MMKNGDGFPVIQGNVVEVDITTGRGTVLQCLTKTLQRLKFNALRER